LIESHELTGSGGLFEDILPDADEGALQSKNNLGALFWEA
jgi:hypothetical protein